MTPAEEGIAAAKLDNYRARQNVKTYPSFDQNANPIRVTVPENYDFIHRTCICRLCARRSELHRYPVEEYVRTTSTRIPALKKTIPVGGRRLTRIERNNILKTGQQCHSRAWVMRHYDANNTGRIYEPVQSGGLSSTRIVVETITVTRDIATAKRSN
jgi:hypothetical protein